MYEFRRRKEKGFWRRTIQKKVESLHVAVKVPPCPTVVILLHPLVIYEWRLSTLTRTFLANALLSPMNFPRSRNEPSFLNRISPWYPLFQSWLTVTERRHLDFTWPRLVRHFMIYQEFVFSMRFISTRRSNKIVGIIFFKSVRNNYTRFIRFFLSNSSLCILDW